MNIITVSTLNEQIKSLVETTFSDISVEGEIGSVTYHNSGHIYFSLKDEKSLIKGVMWRYHSKSLKFRLEKGQKVIINGSVAIYTPRGEYQIIAQHIEPSGKGSLAIAFEQLKSKLSAKGYFSKDIKKSLPKFPSKIALVTAKGSAALQDMLKVAQKRWPLVEIIVIDTPVQGEGASKKIADAISYADTLGADIIVTGRGGGSVEDLWAFNEEVVADAIFNSKTPIVSAVGHEVDFLISDFVSDLRAPTPSAAMEMILPDRDEFLFAIDDMQSRISNRVGEIIQNCETFLLREEKNLKNLSVYSKLDSMSKNFSKLRDELQKSIEYKLKALQREIKPVYLGLDETIQRLIDYKKSRLDIVSRGLESNNPDLRRKDGWAEIILNGKRVSLSQISKNDEFYLVDGKNRVMVKCLKKEKIKI